MLTRLKQSTADAWPPRRPSGAGGAVRARYILRRRRRRGMALIMVLAALTILTVMLTEVQDESSAELGSALSARDALVAEYAAKSSVNLSRLLIAAEPTIRRPLALFGLKSQVPVWEYADRVLGAFNDAAGSEEFLALAGVDPKNGKNLGFEGAGFEVKIVDEDAKINVNVPARSDGFGNIRLAAQLIGLIGGPQYDALFESRDADGQFSDRQTICAAIIDWTDPNQDADVCDPTSETAQGAAAEDSFYEMLKKPYSRKNAAFDSLEELRRVRGMSEDFWSTFVEPDPDKPEKRTITVWGQGQLNINTANPQTVLAFICAVAAPGARICTDPAQAGSFLITLAMLRGITFGMPLFTSPKQFVAALEHKGEWGPYMKEAGIEPITVKSPDETAKAATTESKVFSIYSTGYVRAGKRETRVRVHAVVDFRGAPAPGTVTVGTPSGTPNPGTQPPAGANPGTTTTIVGALQPSTAGNIVYYKVD